MRNVFLLSCLAVIGLAAANPMQAASVCSSNAGNIVTNCGFESGSFSGWSVTGNLQGGIGGNYVGVDNSNPNSGADEAYFGAQSANAQNGSGSLYGPPTTLSQTLVTLPNEYYEVTFFLDSNGCSISDPGCGDYHNYFDASFSGQMLSQMYDMSQQGAYTEYTFITYTGTGPIFNSGLLQFDFTNDDDYFYFDDVTVKPLGVVPEPATYALIAPAMAGLLYLSRRRRQA